MTKLTQLIVQGTSGGALYGLVALCLVLSYKATEVLNFAQGDVVMFSAFLGWGLVVAAGLPFWLSFVVVVCISAALCFLLEAKLCTGDLGRVDDNGRVHLLGRVRAQSVGARGESISPEIAEDALRLSAYVADAILVPAEGGHSAALLSLDEERARKYAQLHRLPFTDYASLLRRPEITSLIAAQVEIANGRLPGNHRVRTTRVVPRSLHPGDEELTPAVRLNCGAVASRYANLFTEPLGV